MRLSYNRRGWFKIIDFLTGTVDLRTGITLPDEYGCFQRRLKVGPFATAAEAIVRG